MGTKAKWASALVAVLALYLTACVDPQEVSDIKAKVDEVQAQQKDILAKLEGIKAGQKQLLAKAPTAPTRPREDPNKVYNVPVGKSFAKGPKDAAVTLVEFGDFQ